jgi:hypothetical protein
MAETAIVIDVPVGRWHAYDMGLMLCVSGITQYVYFLSADQYF